MTRCHELALASALLLTLAAPASAYTLETVAFGNKVKWPAGVVVMESVDASLSNADRAAIDAAMDIWNDAGANFTFLRVTGDGGFGFPNGENEIARTRNHWILGDAPAQAQWWMDPVTGHLWEADVLINDARTEYVATQPAKSDMEVYGGSRRWLVPLLLHELGHVLGLRHENDVFNVMGNSRWQLYANGADAQTHVGADALLGAVALYGTRGSVTDAAMTHWRWTGRSGEYARAGRTRVLRTNGTELPKSDADVRYAVERGQTVLAEFTHETLGNSVSAGTFEMRWSGDTEIDGQDRLLSSTPYVRPPFSLSTRTHPVTIPSDVPTGRTYALGARTSVPNDRDRDNDATYIRVYVRHPPNHLSRCNSTFPCAAYEGDCDDDDECAGDLICAHDVGASYGLSALLDVCEPRPSPPVGSASYCSTSARCAHGEGDCDHDGECAPGRTCVHDVGDLFGFGRWTDVCL